MEVGNGNQSSLLTQITTQLLSGGRASSPQNAPKNLGGDQQLGLFDNDGNSETGARAVVRVRGSRSADDLNLSSDADLDAARENISRLNQREAPLGRVSQTIEPDVPLGQIVDIRV